MTTLGDMRRNGTSIVLYCQGNVGVRWCNHSHQPSMDQLIQYFGVDHDIVANRARLLSRFVCEQCGSRLATLQIVYPLPENGKTGGVGHHIYGIDQKITVEEATRRHHAFMADFRSHGFKTNEEINQESRARIEAKKRAAKSGADFIGPPNPWALRKKGRWL